ncbi:MAG: GNAT family N-acetyltransferase [Clostridia bacterium]|nr:GNAT family N-acetyltransferase [Clostridia bacterium]
METHYEKLSDDNKCLISGFTCESNTDGLSAKERRKVKKHDKEIEDFLKHEAFNEQNLFLNTTHLLISDKNELVGFVSLCNDSLYLAEDSRNKFKTIYASVPAVKIARLGINSKYHGQGYGEQLLKYSLFKSVQMCDISGVAFITLDCYNHRESYYEKFGFSKTDVQPKERTFDTPISMCKHVFTWLNELSKSNKQ